MDGNDVKKKRRLWRPTVHLAPRVERAEGRPRAAQPLPARLIAGLLLLGGAGMLIVSAFLPLPGSVPAVGLILIVFGLITAFPSILTDGSDQVSTVRVVVLLLSSAFVLLVVKHGWSDAHATIDSAWKAILIAAFGGKAAQSFAETIGGSPGTPPKLGAPEYDQAATRPPADGTV